MITFNYAHFIIPTFKHPSFFIFANLFLLGIFNLIFFFP